MAPPYTISMGGYYNETSIIVPSPIYFNETLFDNGTHRWIYFTHSFTFWVHKLRVWIEGKEDTTPPVIANVTQQPAKEDVYPNDNVKVYANVTDVRSGVKQVILNYTTNNQTWTSVEMTNVEGDVWSATIPEFPYHTTVTYTIVAKDNVDNIITTKEMGYEYQYHIIPEFPSDTTPPSISILSPENKTYPTKDVPLAFTVSESTSWIGYSLDGQMNVTVSGESTMFGLSDGTHTVTVYAKDTAGNMGYSNTVYFTVDTVSPKIEILSPENKAYATGSVSLSFTVDEVTSWIGYSLDGQANVTITENTTLSGLSSDSYSLIVYARDTAGNIGASEMVYFSIGTQQPEPQPAEPLQLWIIAAIVVIAVVGTALLVYFAKIKKTTEKVK